MVLGDVDKPDGEDGRGDRGARDGHDGDQHGGQSVSTLISSWEQRSTGGEGGEAMELEVTVGGGGSRLCQEFKSLCGKFDVRKEDGAEEVARMRLGTI